MGGGADAPLTLLQIGPGSGRSPSRAPLRHRTIVAVTPDVPSEPDPASEPNPASEPDQARESNPGGDSSPGGESDAPRDPDADAPSDDVRTPTTFAEIGLRPRVLRAITAAGFTDPLPVQAHAIPDVLAGLDVVVSAETGSGKTLAYLAPLASLLLSGARRRGDAPRAVILVPTRELAQQVADVADRIARAAGLRVVLVHGGVPVSREARELKHGSDVVIATPGRLADHARRGGYRSERVAHLVLDEADRMLDMGFRDAVLALVTKMPPERQTLLLSATVPPELEKLAVELLREPTRIKAETGGDGAAVPEGIEHRATVVRQPLKRLLLPLILDDPAVRAALVFVNTRHRCEVLARLLSEQGVPAEALHGARSQTERNAALDGCRAGEVRVLVATDLAERGLDLPHLTHVINFDLPGKPATYAHRVGRTARAFGKGIALTLVTPPEEHSMQGIAKRLGVRVAWTVVEAFDYEQRPEGLDPLIPPKKRGRSPAGDPDAPKRKIVNPVRQKQEFWDRARKRRQSKRDDLPGPDPGPHRRRR